jgi:TM2 domain-containing membrane protein YozV
MDIKLKVSYKAALLSLFVFPGAGQLYLKRYSRGLVIMFLFFTGLGYMIWFVMVSVLNSLDHAMVMMKGDNTNLQHLQDFVGSKMLTTGPYQDVLFYVILCFWIFAVIDAYRIGRQREPQDKETGEIGKVYGDNKKDRIRW